MGGGGGQQHTLQYTQPAAITGQSELGWRKGLVTTLVPPHPMGPRCGQMVEPVAVLGAAGLLFCEERASFLPSGWWLSFCQSTSIAPGVPSLLACSDHDLFPASGG